MREWATWTEGPLAKLLDGDIHPRRLMIEERACTAAQTVFMAKSTTTPSCRMIILESWPPISKMVRTPALPSWTQLHGP